MTGETPRTVDICRATALSVQLVYSMELKQFTRKKYRPECGFINLSHQFNHLALVLSIQSDIVQFTTADSPSIGSKVEGGLRDCLPRNLAFDLSNLVKFQRQTL